MNVCVVNAIANWPLTHMKNPIIYNQTPKFKDLGFKNPNSYVKSPLILIILPKNMLRDYLFDKGPPMAMIMTMSPFRVGKSP